MSQHYYCDTARPARRQRRQQLTRPPGQRKSDFAEWRDTEEIQTWTLIDTRILIREFIESGRNLL